MEQTSTQLNATSDEVLSECVSVLDVVGTGNTHHLPPIAPFITSNVMLRLHHTSLRWKATTLPQAGAASHGGGKLHRC